MSHEQHVCFTRSCETGRELSSESGDSGTSEVFEMEMETEIVGGRKRRRWGRERSTKDVLNVKMIVAKPKTRSTLRQQRVRSWPDALAPWPCREGRGGPLISSPAWPLARSLQ